MTKLFSFLKSQITTVKNSMPVSSMCMYNTKDGFAIDFHLTHLESYSPDRYGLLIHEATSVSPKACITYHDPRIWKELGVALIDTSIGTDIPKAKTPIGPNYQMQFVKQKVKTRTE